MGKPEPIEPVYLVAFSGHRPSDAKGRTRAELVAATPRIKGALERVSEKARARGGRLELVCSAAAGADLIAIDAATELGVPVHVILPMPESAFLEDFQGASADDLDRARAAIDNARSDAGTGSFRVAQGDTERPACYHEANMELLEAADALIVLWNRTPARGLGGTGELFDEARRRDLPSVVVNPADPEDTSWDGPWDDWPEPCDRLDELNVDLTNPGEPDPDNQRRGEGPAWALFAKLDAIANRAGGAFRKRLLASLILHFAAALIAAINAAVSPVFQERMSHVGETTALFLKYTPKALTAVEFVMVLVAWVLMLQAARIRSHDSWRRCRFAAELMHSCIMSARLLDPIRPIVTRHDRAWGRFALAASIMAHGAEPESTLEQRRDRYLEGRVRNQADHFESKLPAAESRAHTLTHLASVMSALAPLVIGIALCVKLFVKHEDMAENYAAVILISFLPVAMPLTAGAVTSLIVALDAGRRAQRYGLMVRRLERVASVLPGVKTEGALRREVETTEEILLDELIEWDAASRNMGH